MHQRDLGVRDAVGGRQVVVLGSRGEGGVRQPGVTAVDAEAVILLPERIGRVRNVGSRCGHRGGGAVDPEHPGVGRAGPADAGVDRDLGPQAVRLQLGDQLGDTRGIECVGVLDYVSHDVSTIWLLVGPE